MTITGGPGPGPGPGRGPRPGSGADARESLALAAAAGIFRLPVPTPFPVGRVNCYLIEDEPLTLVDTGPNSGKALDELEQALAAHGRRIEDVGLLVLTHQHVDHTGLLEVIVRRSGAEVAALHLLAPYLASFSRSAAADDRFAHAVMLRHGVPADLAVALGALGGMFRAFGSSGRVTQGLRDGDELALRDRTLRVLHRPGHSPSDTIFFDEQRAILIGGDHLLARVSSNPLIARPLAGGGDGAGRTHALVQYMDSLQSTSELPAHLTLPGHGDPITDHVALIEERLRMHDRRARKIRQMLDGGPRTAYELAAAMWGDVALTQAYLTLSEVLGHLDLLVLEGQVRERADGNVARFEAAV